MTKEEIDIQKEIEKYFTESTCFGKDKIRNFMDIVNKALKQKGERIEELENKIADIKANCDLAIEGRDIKIRELEENAELKKNYEDSLIACDVLKVKVDTLAQPSPLESMQDALITTQKVAYEKQKEQLAQAKEILQAVVHQGNREGVEKCTIEWAEQFLKEIEK